MPDEGSYEIVPYKEIVELKKQIQELKLKGGEVPSRDLLKSMGELTKGMNSMLQLFKSAAEELKLEEKEGETVAKKIEPIMDKLDDIIDQNKTIAEGMVSIADMVKEMKGDEAPEPKRVEKPAPPPRMPYLEPLKVERFESNRGAMPPPIPPMHHPGAYHEEYLGPPGAPSGLPPLGPAHRAPPGMPPLGPPPWSIPAGPMPGAAELPPLGPMPEKPKKKGLFSGLFKKK